MDQALHESIQVYHRMGGPQEAGRPFPGSLWESKKPAIYGVRSLILPMSPVSWCARWCNSATGTRPNISFSGRWVQPSNGFQRAISGFKSLYAKLGPGQGLAKTELAKLIRATERKSFLHMLVRRAGASEKPTGPATASERLGPRAAEEHGYDYWQGKIDDELDRLKAQGVDVYKLHDSTLKILPADKEFWPGWTQ